MKTVEIPESVSLYVEKCFFEWQGIQKILGYITQNNACTEHLDYYTNLALEKNYILEKAKTETVNEYIQVDEGVNFDYEFDFDKNLIKYWEV